ncbi:MAG TPA: DUF429 domain-containing protein [Deltaproteobacteria bacterium]|nr:DUF429 domain-containing protein [Deltaproteobacteria bacterium]HPR56668.1 DUF429 domain-containing protein [Deltaproteobacteria bacterium]HXK48746.1 DUF429 domain-containing protein [Deltaproteobacteria bacterium]
MKYVGVDGCRGGWFAVMMGDDGSWKTGLFAGLDELITVSPGASHILVDIPIGLPASRPRQCDREARRILGPGRGSSVFPAPCRRAVHAHDYGEACRLNREHLGTMISLQTWYICGKIAQADDLLRDRPDLVGIIRESHPELCLWALAGEWPMRFSKKSRQGRLERMTVLETVFPDAVQVYEHALQSLRRSDAARDDIIDALALAVSAGICRGDVEAVPQTPEHDDEGLPMEIVLPKHLNTHCPVR